MEIAQKYSLAKSLVLQRTREKFSSNVLKVVNYDFSIFFKKIKIKKH